MTRHGDGWTRLWLAGTAVFVLLAGCTADTADAIGVVETTIDLDAVVEQLSRDVDAENLYRDPRTDERRLTTTSIRKIIKDTGRTVDIAADMREAGFLVHDGKDSVTGRNLSIFAAMPDGGRPWGVIVVDRDAPRINLLIEVPHPRSDADTEELGLMSFRAIPGAALLIAGAHRKAGNGAADVAHNDDSMFHAIAAEFARAGVSQLQLHGFADLSLPGYQVVVSTGSTPRRSAARRAAERFTSAGFTTCRAWAMECGMLEGATNEQGKAAGFHRSTFVHIEVSWTARQGQQRRDAIIAALVAADLNSG